MGDPVQKSMTLSRNSLRWLLCRRNLDDLESKLGGFRLEVFGLWLAVLGFVERRSSVHVFHSVAEHEVDQTCQLGGHGLNRHRRVQSASKTAELCSCPVTPLISLNTLASWIFICVSAFCIR